MTGLWRSACLVGLTAALALSTSGCSNYTYFNVDIKLDDSVDFNTTQKEIGYCSVFVLDAATDKRIEEKMPLTTTEGSSACPPGLTGRDLGVMNYSTAKSSGTLRFFVDMTNQGVKVSFGSIVQGSVDGAVKPGEIISLVLSAEACGTSCKDTSAF
jgi:hypothetical protein